MTISLVFQVLVTILMISCLLVTCCTMLVLFITISLVYLDASEIFRNILFVTCDREQVTINMLHNVIYVFIWMPLT